MEGLGVQPRDRWYGWLYKFKVYRQLATPLDTQWALADPLVETTPRRDGLLCRDLILYGIPVWLMALTQLEPFHQLSGYEKASLDGVMGPAADPATGWPAPTIDNFMIRWLELLLATREMPSLSTVYQSGITSMNLVPGEVYYDSEDRPEPGFREWPCAVLDSMMGIEIGNPRWWTCEGHGTSRPTPEMMTDEQRAVFSRLNAAQYAMLLQKNLYTTFLKLRSAVDNCRKPPDVSPSMRLHPELRRTILPRYAVRPKEEPVRDSDGADWPGHRRQSSITVRVPISVQPNPDPNPDGGWARRAVTDVVFGYEIAVTPRGGDPIAVPAFRWPLRRGSGEPSLYHEIVVDQQGHRSEEIRGVPHYVDHEFGPVMADTWVTVTDGEHRVEIAEGQGPVSFNMTVELWDQWDRIPFPTPSTTTQAQENEVWNDQHGVIWLSIHADANANRGRSFELLVEMTETAAVDEQGSPTDETAKLKKYTAGMSIPVDVATIHVPSGYFDSLRRKADKDRHTYQKTRPRPGPYPLDVSELRVILREQSRLAQTQLNLLGRITNRPDLTTEQALAELDAIESGMATMSRPTRAKPTSMNTATTRPVLRTDGV